MKRLFLRENNSKASQWVALTGAVGVVAYPAHVVIGGMLWAGCSHLSQTISERTADGAPALTLLRSMTRADGVLTVVFALYVHASFRQTKEDRLAIAGAVALIVLERTSFIGYSLFPLDPTGSVLNLRNTLHVAVTVVVVISSLAASYLAGIGLNRNSRTRTLGRFILCCAVVITASGS